jgi:hypothetical protein
MRYCTIYMYLLALFIISLVVVPYLLISLHDILFI